MKLTPQAGKADVFLEDRFHHQGQGAGNPSAESGAEARVPASTTRPTIAFISPMGAEAQILPNRPLWLSGTAGKRGAFPSPKVWSGSIRQVQHIQQSLAAFQTRQR